MAEMPDVGGKCNISECNRIDFLPFTCPLCKCLFWHRHADEHLCDAVLDKVPKPRAQLKIPIIEPSLKPEKPALESKSKPINPADQKKMDRILIMKLKMNAKMYADIPAQEQIFLFVEGDCVNGRHAVAVSKSWTIGRCASAIKKLLLLDESKTVKILKEDCAVDYADTVRIHLNDMDTVRIELI
ncbi:hypothetical protein RB195_011985 [Necator americanus]|uniref:AN1-type domain-containing protein n=1 Tax=Necator americanus TaxID=51031 RepID=A0ABR1D688_NECAM